MFAMFHLGRMDVLPVGDLGVRNGMKMLYGLPVRLCLLHPILDERLADLLIAQS